MSVNGENVQFTLDTGSAVTLLTADTGKTLKLNYDKPDHLLSAANGSNIDVIGTSVVDISYKDVTTNATVYVSDSSNTNLLGRPEIESLKLLSFINQVEDGQFDPIKSYPKLFNGLFWTIPINNRYSISDIAMVHFAGVYDGLSEENILSPLPLSMHTTFW